MEKEQRNRLQKATQEARRLLEEEFSRQLLETYDINVAAGRWSEEPGTHLQAEQRLLREKLLAWIEHRSAQINDEKEALLLALREMAFTALNRFVALKLMEARELVRPCVSGGLESEGFHEFTAVAQGLVADQEGSYRLYLETIFEDVSRELRALFDPRDPASLLWPKRTALLELLDILDRPELAELWIEDETLGWVYQYFNGDAERKKMREESSAPRNSRELAVRNQFFTPRYVVEFLTDNTLGRIWYEMRQGNTGLKERCRYLVRRPNEIWLQPGEEAPAEVVADEPLSQEELLQQLVPIPHRPLKDPREIRMLDPACGSMHFGLYAFDLYLAIYAEAWEIAAGSDQQAQQGEAFSPFVDYAAGFADKATFLLEVPRLILLHNIHGIDIDPRATQIAKLTLWLRAQRAWKEQQVDIADRRPITRSNVVCAEPMPGERELLADFVDQQFLEVERGLIQQLLEAIFDRMQLAGEAGSLLKIEDEIRDAIDQARREWQKLAVQQRDLFRPTELAALGQVGSSLNTELQDLTKNFWVNIEERIYTALREYSEQVESNSGFQRRLFAEDAAQGFAFIDVCRKRYDVALMNPPFGEASNRLLVYLEEKFSSWNRNVLCAFIEQQFAGLSSGGFLASVMDKSLINKSTYEEFRQSVLLKDERLAVVIDLGWEVLDANVEVACCIARSKRVAKSLTDCFDVRDVAPNSKNVSLLASVRGSEGKRKRVHTHPAASFAAFPNSAIVYDLPDSLLSTFFRFKNLKSLGLASYTGHQLESDRHFILFWEIPFGCGLSPDKHYCHLYNGGEYSRFCSLPQEVVRFGYFAKLSPQDVTSYTFVLRNREKHFLQGVCFGVRGEFLDAHALPSGVLFTVEGQALPTPQPETALFLIGLLNSAPASRLLNTYCGQHKYSGYVNLLPCPPINAPKSRDLACSVAESAAIKRQAFTHAETSLIFAKPIWASRKSLRLSEVASQLFGELNNLSRLLNEKVQKNNLLVCDLYELNDQESRADVMAYASTMPTDSVPGFQIDSTSALERQIAGDAISYSAGVAYGRWDIRCATGEQTTPELTDPFAPLPVCPPGQLQNAQGLPASPEDVLPSYPVRIPWDGILVDDPNHSLDLERCIHEVIKIIWSGQEGGATAESIEHEACDILGVNSLRDYFRKPAGFFADHLKRYSKTRRQAPIYWQLSAGNGNFSAWLYYHRFTPDTLYRVLRDFVEPRIQEAEREQFELESQGGLLGDAASLLQKAQVLLQDLQLFKSELELVAPLWNPNLNDGVIINHAILWRITPYTPWQKKCKECWDKLVKGDYDWAHLAFHLWPERVIRKCQTDRSLAIAHGLEEHLWQETSKGNWLQRQLSEAELQALLAEYSKPAVQNALERFLAASPPVAAARTRAPRAGKSSSISTTRRARGSAPEVDAETSRQTLLVLTAAPADGLGRNAIAELLGVEAASLTAVIKQLKEGGQIEQLGAARGAKYRLTESGLAAVESQAGENQEA